MKISKLIELLEKAKCKKGDVEVCITISEYTSKKFSIRRVKSKPAIYNPHILILRDHEIVIDAKG